MPFKKIRNIIESIESDNTGFYFWILALFAIIALRGLFEGLLEIHHRVPDFHSFFIHFVLFYLSVFLTYVLLFKLLSKGNIVKVTKVVIVFFSIVLIVPIIDFLVSNGAGYNLDYVFGGPALLFHQFFTYMSHFPGFGVSPGQKILVLLAIIFGVIFFWIKTKSRARLPIYAFLIYACTAFYAFLPSFLGMLFYGIPLWTEMAGTTTPGPVRQGLDLAFALLIIFQLILWLLLWNKNKLIALIKNIRPLTALHFAVLMPVFGMLVFRFLNSCLPLDSISVFTLIISIFLAFLAGLAIKDLADFNSNQKENSSNPLVSQAFSPEEYKKIALFEAVLALILALIVGYAAFVFVLCAITLFFIYSMPPFSLRKFPLISTFSLSIVSLLFFLAGFFAVGAENLSSLPLGFPLLIIIFVSLAFNAKDLKGIDSDKQAGIKTLPVLFGERQARKIIALLIAVCYLLAPLLLNLTWVFFPLSIVFAAISVFLLLQKKAGNNLLLLVYFFYAFPVVLSFVF